MMHEELFQFELVQALLRDYAQLVFRHFRVRLITNAADLRTILRGANDTPEVDDRAGFWRRKFAIERKSRISKEHVADGICHACWKADKVAAASATRR